MTTNRRWAAVVLTVLGIGLLPWAFWLGHWLPSRKVAEHWDLAWVAFDLVLAVSLLGTALALVRQSDWLRSLAAATGALLLADAWFDVITASTSNERWFAIGLALGAELPLAGICFALSRPPG